MRYYLLPKGAKQYKANLHCHTNVSDGTLSPSEIKVMYQRAGYSAVAFTDHEVFLRHTELTDASFVALHGYETAIKDGTPEERTGHFMKVHHLCLLHTKVEVEPLVASKVSRLIYLCIGDFFINNISHKNYVPPTQFVI